MKGSQENLERQWQEILNLSTQMREFAEKRDWNSLQDAIAARELLLSSHFSDKTLALQAAENVARIQKLKEIDGAIMELTNKNKQLLAKEIVKLQRGRTGLSAYTEGLLKPH